jgi:hypothetical protein
MLGQLREVPGARTADGKLSWAPELDLRNCGIDMVRRALLALEDDQAWQPWFADYCKLSGVTGADVGHTAALFADALARFLKDPASDPGQHLRDVGFFEEPLPCQQALFAQMGQIALGHFAYAIRQTTAPADSVGLPYQAALQRVLDGGAQLASAWRPERPEGQCPRGPRGPAGPAGPMTPDESLQRALFALRSYGGAEIATGPFQVRLRCRSAVIQPVAEYLTSLGFISDKEPSGWFTLVMG